MGRWEGWDILWVPRIKIKFSEFYFFVDRRQHANFAPGKYSRGTPAVCSKQDPVEKGLVRHTSSAPEPLARHADSAKQTSLSQKEPGVARMQCTTNVPRLKGASRSAPAVRHKQASVKSVLTRRACHWRSAFFVMRLGRATLLMC